MGNHMQTSVRNRRHDEGGQIYIGDAPIVQPVTSTISTINMTTIKSSSSMLSSVRSSIAQHPSVSKLSGASNNVAKKTTTSSVASSNTSGQNDESDLDRLKLELRDAKRQVYEREQQLLKLHREIHKLRSVLDHSDVMNALKPSPSMTMLLTSGNVLSILPNKKQGVSSESYGSMTSLGTDPMSNINFVWKDFDCRRIIQEALFDNSFLKNYLNQEQLDLIVDSMYEKEFSKGHYICRRGAYGCHLYVITYGQCEIIDAHDKPVNQIGPGKAFGELALLYNCTRTASVKTLTRVRTWVLDRKIFQLIMMKTCLDRTQSVKQFLKKVPLLRNLSDEKIAKMADVVEVEHFPRGEYICRQGAAGYLFYIIMKGSVKVTRTRVCKCEGVKESPTREATVRTLGVGDYFGEQALLLGLQSTEGNEPKEAVKHAAARTANVISEDCECLVLDQLSFVNFLGESGEIRGKSYNDDELDVEANNANGCRTNLSPTTMKNVDCNEVHRSGSFTAHYDKSDPFFAKLILGELEHLSQLGMGGFGIVNLVRCKSNHDKVFVLKRCAKDFVRASHQQQHIVNEKLVMQRVSGRHQFIIQLYRTFRDEKNVYFLMEASLGGELWTVLRQKGPFTEPAARFYLGCVIEALQYLHNNNIIYRDLKPENCLIDADGYLKITDFGFSKFLQPGDKTWTFCGTSEYVCPEIILNRGHDRSVDIWSIGILLYELLTGIPPFTSSDPLQTYHKILRGFDSIGFDQNIFSKSCVTFIRALCRENPSERLGIRGRSGFADIKRHKWFAGFNWASLVARKLIPPVVPQLESATDTRYFDVIDPEPNNELCPPKKSDSAARRSSGSGSAKRSSHSTPSESLSSRSKPGSSNSDEKSCVNIFDFNNNWESYF